MAGTNVSNDPTIELPCCGVPTTMIHFLSGAMYVIVATPVRFFQTKSGVAALTSPLLHEASLSCPAPVRMNALLSWSEIAGDSRTRLTRVELPGGSVVDGLRRRIAPGHVHRAPLHPSLRLVLLLRAVPVRKAITEMMAHKQSTATVSKITR